MICAWQVASLWWCFLLRNLNPASATECNKCSHFSRPSNPPCWVSPWAPVARAQVAFLPTSADVCCGSLPLRHILWCELRRKFLRWRLRMILQSMLTPILLTRMFLEAPSYHNKAVEIHHTCSKMAPGTFMYFQGWQPVSKSTIKKSGSIGAFMKEHMHLQSAFVASNCALKERHEFCFSLEEGYTSLWYLVYICHVMPC